MEVIQSKAEIIKTLREYKGKKTICVIPTMGALHEGHLSLIDKAKETADVALLWCFVNPTQFNDPEDFKKYPISTEQDIALSKERGVDIFFLPQVEEIYPNSLIERKTSLKASSLADSLCGAKRPGHFDGVVTVVSIIFNLIQPDYAVFGEKDFQQLKTIEQMCKDLHFQTKIISAPLVRESTGLALSSRNVRLTREEKDAAITISKALFNAKKNTDNLSCLQIKKVITSSLSSLLKLEYLSIVSSETLKEFDDTEIPLVGSRILIAAWAGQTRLIDNIEI